MRAKIQLAALGAVALLVAACASVEDPYVPNRVGSLEPVMGQGTVTARLLPEASEARIGDVVRFRVILRNEGQERIWMPERPDVAMRWIYPNGRRDNSVGAGDSGTASLVALEPGREIVLRCEVPTYYFDDPGITEFQALVPLADARQVPSDRFGVLLHRAH